MIKTSAIAAIKILRPINSIMMGIGVLIGIQVSNPNWIQSQLISLTSLRLDHLSFSMFSFLVGFLLSCSSMVFNDYIDYKIDAINFPTKPIPSGAISRSFALTYAIILALAGISLSLYLWNPVSFIIALSGLAVAYLYNIFLKRKGIVGNTAVAYTTTLPFLYGSSLMNFSNLLPTLVLCTLAFLSNLSREIIKGIVDIIGDAALGIRTIANTKGAKFAAKLSFMIILPAVLLSPMPFIMGTFKIYFFPLILLADFIFLYYSYALIKSPVKENALRAKKYFLLAMFLSLIAFFLASI